MSSISNIIEAYLKKMLNSSNDGAIEIQRNELAERFNCVPSQINYVLSTRFTIKHGFIIESKRGGGGYVRIEKVPMGDGYKWLKELYILVGDAINQKQAMGILGRLHEEKIITTRELYIMKAAVDRSALRVDLPWRDKLRAEILKAMLSSLALQKQ
ncbi:CtsR family transcriptional regulator [Desulfofalx alkaliphila]|uniref:CtsR family transcriptional regulator n=1 Tax=Desulfofalx alkaliphila TaxID=105483 RepID=UPI0004E1F9C2|nr:CtsR family transcriptional regulator [Desulfofalx alkaliphila]